MGNLADDLRYAARTLRKSPGFTALAILTLALGVGANTAIWSLVQAVILTPLPIPAADRVVRVTETFRRDGIERRPVSYPDFLDWRAGSRTLADLTAWTGTSFTIGGEVPDRVDGELVSASYFHLLGRKAVRGRTFRPEEDRELGAHPVAVVSDDFWRTHLGASPAAVGGKLLLNGQPFTVIGVLAPGFHGLDDDSDVWIPMTMMATAVPDSRPTARGSRWLDVVARLRPGVTPAQAQAEMDALSARLAQAFPNSNRDNGALVVPLSEEVMGGFRPVLVAVLGAVGFVLLIACANLASLSLARATARQRETAIRAALGASRGRLARQLLAESLLLAVAGGLAGLLVAAWAIDLLAVWSPVQLPSFVHPGLDPAVLGFAWGIALLSGLLVGLAPALQAASSVGGVGSGLLQSGERAGEGGGRRTRRGLVVAEVALALLLLAGAGLMIQSFRHLQAIDPGFRPEGLLTLRVPFPAGKFPGGRAWEAAERLSERLRALPGVTAVAVGSNLPFNGDTASTLVNVEGREREIGEHGLRIYTHQVSPGFFAALGARRLSGRDFTAADGPESPRVALVSRRFAERILPGLDPLGRRLRGRGKKDPWVTIVGVVDEIRWGRLAPDPKIFPEDPDVYYPLAQEPIQELAVAVRSNLPAEDLAAALRREAAAIDRGMPVYALERMADLVARQTARSRFGAFLLGGFGALALLLAALGVYGVLGYNVARRVREIGVRMALGARRGEVLRLILAEALTLTAAGVVLGLLGAAALPRVLGGQLYGLSATDPATLAAAALVLAAAALVAGWLPARRATRVDPAVVLKGE